MTYSKLLNIESNKSNNLYKFTFNKTFSFRFLTPDFVNGIELNSKRLNKINDSDVKNNNWYKFTKDIQFNNLNKFDNLVLQIISEEDFGNNDISINESFKIVNKNEWYKCQPNDPNCGLILKNFILNQKKPLQEIDSSLKYKINGDAELIKNKHIKTGKYDSDITIIGFEPNVINFISNFKLDCIKQNKNNNVKTFNKYTESINSKIVADDSNDINNKIEMIKFQIKNYFVENNKELDIIHERIDDNENSSSKNLIKIENILYQLSEYDIEFNNITNNIQKINDNVKDISESFKPFEEQLASLIILTDDLLKSKSMLDNNLSKLSEKVESLNKEQIDNQKKNKQFLLDKINNNVKDFNNKITEINNKIQKLSQKSNNIEKLIIKIKSELDNKIIILKKELESDYNKKINSTKKDLDNYKIILEENSKKVNDNNIKLVNSLTSISNKLDNYTNNFTLKINELINYTNKISKINKENFISLSDRVNQNIVKIDINENNIGDIKDELKILNSNLDNQKEKLEDSLLGKTVWSNKNKNIIKINLHQVYLSLDFCTENKNFKTESFYLLTDFKDLKLPYYCWKINKINDNKSAAKLVILVPLEKIN